MAAVEFENPFGGVVEEVAVVGDGNDGAGKTHEKLFEPLDRLGVEVVGRFIQQQHVGARQEQAAQGDAAFLAAGEIADRRVPRRQAQGVGGDFELRLAVGAGHGDDGLVPGLFLGELVEVGVRLGIGGIDFIQLLLGLHDLAQAGLDLLADCSGGIELGFLRQIADGNAGQVLHFPVIFLVRPGHDAQHGGFARAVEAQQADLGAREERKGDVLDDLTLGGNDLAHAEHRHYVLGHESESFEKKIEGSEDFLALG